MERLKLDLVQLNKALKTLQNSMNLQLEVTKLNNPQILLGIEDSTIQRFEYSYESFWKFLKRYLALKYSLEELKSPRKVFHACVEMNICSLEEGSIFFDMADDRNETSHTYNIESTRIILVAVPRYYSAMMNVTERCNEIFELKGI